MYYPCNGGLMMGWGWLAMIAGTVLLVGLVVLGVVLLTRQASQRTASSPSDAERILAERYARGEIDDQEYQQRLGVLRGR